MFGPWHPDLPHFDVLPYVTLEAAYVVLMAMRCHHQIDPRTPSFRNIVNNLFRNRTDWPRTRPSGMGTAVDQYLERALS